MMVGGAVVAAGEPILVSIALAWCAATTLWPSDMKESRLTRDYPAGYAAYRGTIDRWIPSRRRGSSHDACSHRALLRPLLAELHTPLIVAPALMKPGIVKAVALLSSSG
jgi:hypothetical protein